MKKGLESIDLTPRQLKTVTAILKQYIPDARVWAYGSRVKFTSKPQSDLDIVVFADEDKKSQIYNIKEAMEESDLPFAVDILVWDDIPESFHKNIEEGYFLLQTKSIAPKDSKEIELREIAVVNDKIPSRAKRKIKSMVHKHLVIDARKLGTMVDRKRCELNDDDIAKISDTYHAWRGEEYAIERRGEYKDITGFSFSAKLDDIKEHGYVLTPGRFVGAEDDADDDVPFAEKITRLTAKLKDQFAEGDRLEQDIKKNLKGFGYDL